MTVKKWIVAVGTLLTVLMLAVMGLYVQQEAKREIQPAVYPEEIQ